MTGGELEATKRLVWNDLKLIRKRLDTPEPVVADDVEQIDLFGG
jgi:hypothetical protein